MKRIARGFGIIVLGSMLWGLGWNLAGAVARMLWPEHLDPGTRIEHTGILVGLLAVSILLSLAVGALAARLGGVDARRTLVALALVQLAIGSGVQASVWQLLPLWYHLIFLVAIVPATLAGGALVLRGARSS
jgi:MFS family permease